MTPHRRIGIVNLTIIGISGIAFGAMFVGLALGQIWGLWLALLLLAAFGIAGGVSWHRMIKRTGQPRGLHAKK